MALVDRRGFLTNSSALALVALLGSTRAAATPVREPAGPPRARVEPVTDDYFGDRVVDPYRWMENRSDPEFLPFLDAQNSYTRLILDSIPGRAALERRLVEVTGAVDRVGIVERAGDQLVYVKAKAGDSKVSIWSRPLAGGDERRLVNAEALGATEAIAEEWAVSPDGRLLLYGIDEGGRELPDHFVLDIASGRRLPDRVGRAFTIDVPTLHWMPDGSGFFYTQFAPGREMDRADSLEDTIVRFHRLGDNQELDATVAGRSAAAAIAMRPVEIPMVVTAPGSPWALLAIVDGTGPFVRLYAAPAADAAAGRAAWSEIASYADEIRQYAIAGDRVALLSAHGSPRGRVLVGPIARFDRTALTELPLGEVIPERVAAAKDALYVQTMNGGYGRVKRVGWDGSVSDVPLPFEGGLFSVRASPSFDGAFVDLGGWVQPFTPRRYDPRSGRTEELGLARFPFDLSGYEAVRTFATARDGTRVPISLAMKRGIRRDGSHRVLMQTYGAYGISQTPNFYGRLLPLLEQGGILAFAHVRGGGEYGHAWHMGGFKATKSNTWRDLIACAEELIRQNYTTRRRLAIRGGSAGGIAVGRAMTERPDLFAAVVSDVGLNNPLRFEAAQNGSSNVQEIGSVAVREEYPLVRAMDTYHAVRSGVTYPSVLLTTGINDPRVPPWQVAKLAARLQASGTPNPVLMRVAGATGHGGASNISGAVAEAADIYAFVLWRTGHPNFQRQRRPGAPDLQ